MLAKQVLTGYDERCSRSLGFPEPDVPDPFAFYFRFNPNEFPLDNQQNPENPQFETAGPSGSTLTDISLSAKQPWASGDFANEVNLEPKRQKSESPTEVREEDHISTSFFSGTKFKLFTFILFILTFFITVTIVNCT